MNLVEVIIRNFRSIDRVNLPIKAIGNSATISLVGKNESGKSNLLEILSCCTDDIRIMMPDDFYDEDKEISVTLSYEFTDKEIQEIRNDLKQLGMSAEVVRQLSFEKLTICKTWASPSIEGVANYELGVNPEKQTKLTSINGKIVTKSEVSDHDLDISSFILESDIGEKIDAWLHNIVFWKFAPEYLVTEPIDLNSFSKLLEKNSVPLLNSFLIAGVSRKDIAARISRAKNSPSSARNLQNLLSDKVTEHIRNIWPDHAVRIVFHIDGDHISMLVEDDEVQYRAQTMAQRSDGFRQFVSFLLTSSAQFSSQALKDTILILDEPEIHLHPGGQMDILAELMRIGSVDSNNIVIFATHSNFLIDKENPDRCLRVHKTKTGRTKVDPIGVDHPTTISEVNYDVFALPTTDYHNELYGFLEMNDKLSGLVEDRTWIKMKKDGTAGDKIRVSLSKYIRHAIHHPENSLNKQYSRSELVSSIEDMRKLKYASPAV